MKILEITPFALPNIGGAETHLEKLTNYLAGHGHTVAVSTYQPLTTPIKAPKVEHRIGITIYRQRWFGQGWFTVLENWPFPFVFAYLFPGLLWNTLRILWREGPFDVVHAHGLVSILIARVIKMVTGVRIVASTHAIYGLADRPILARILRWLFKGFDWVLAVGEPSMVELAEYAGVERICVHPNWVDTEFWKPLEAPRLGVLFAGRMIEKKGIKQLREAERILKTIPFCLVSNEPPDELRELYNAADITILPSQYPEGFSAVVCESLACGTPVMVPRDGVMPSILTDEVAVFLPPKPTADDIAKALREYVPRSREKCREYALEHFSERNAEIIEKALAP